MIDTDRDKNGDKILKRLKGKRSGGLPWLVILDADGEELISSNRPPKGGNIGSPVQPEECDYFITMLEKTKTRLTDKDLELLAKELETHAKKHRR